jgi:hypothetical protein
MKILTILIIIIAVLLIVWIIGSYVVIKSLEEPSYSVVSKEK